MKRIAAGLGVTFIALMGWALKVGTVQAAGQDEASTPEFYTSNVQPIFQANCYRCHGGMNHRGGLNIQTRAGMMKGGHDGQVLVPGDPAKSLLVRLIRHEGPADEQRPMPPQLTKISDEDIATVERWVKAGAIMPGDASKP